MTKFRRLAATVSAAAIVTCTATAVMAANIFVVGGKPDDPFWSIVKRGAEDAGKVAEAQGGKVVWLGPQNYDNLGVDAAELIRQAIDQGADAIVGPDWVPEAMDLPSRRSSTRKFRWSSIMPAASKLPIALVR